MNIFLANELVQATLAGIMLIGIVRSLKIKLDVNKLLDQITHGARTPTRKILSLLKRVDKWAKRNSPYRKYPRLRPYVDKTERCWSYVNGSYLFLLGASFMVLVLTGHSRYVGIKGLATYVAAMAIGFGLFYAATLFIARGNELRGK